METLGLTASTVQCFKRAVHKPMVDVTADYKSHFALYVALTGNIVWNLKSITWPKTLIYCLYV